MEPFHIYLAMSEAVGHLDLLHTEGAIVTEEKGGIIRHLSKTGPKR
jgi:hypothetical protein